MAITSFRKRMLSIAVSNPSLLPIYCAAKRISLRTVLQEYQKACKLYQDKSCLLSRNEFIVRYIIRQHILDQGAYYFKKNIYIPLLVCYLKALPAGQLVSTYINSCFSSRQRSIM